MRNTEPMFTLRQTIHRIKKICCSSTVRLSLEIASTRFNRAATASSCSDALTMLLTLQISIKQKIPSVLFDISTSTIRVYKGGDTLRYVHIRLKLSKCKSEINKCVSSFKAYFRVKKNCSEHECRTHKSSSRIMWQSKQPTHTTHP